MLISILQHACSDYQSKTATAAEPRTQSDGHSPTSRMTESASTDFSEPTLLQKEGKRNLACDEDEDEKDEDPCCLSCRLLVVCAHVLV